MKGNNHVINQTHEQGVAIDSKFNEDEILNRFKVIPHDIGDKVISLSEDVLVTCDNWHDPQSDVSKFEETLSDPRKKNLVIYDLWHDHILNRILRLIREKCQNHCWKLIEFRGCQERHINAVLKLALEMDIVQSVAFSLTNEKYDPMRRCNDTTFDVIASSMEKNRRFECLIFHSRPIQFMQYEALKNLRLKRLHFLENVCLHPEEIPELAAGLKANTSLESFSFLGGVTHITDVNQDVSRLVQALTSHPSLERLSLCLKSTMGCRINGLKELLWCRDSVLQCLTLTGGFTINSFFPNSTFYHGLGQSSLKHLHLKDIFLFPHDVIDLAKGLQKNESIESLSVQLDASDVAINVAPIAFAIQDNHRIKRLALAGKCSLREGVYGITKLLSSKTSILKDLHLSGAFLDKSSRVNGYVRILTEGLRNNNRIETLDLSVNDLSDAEAVMIYKQTWTCPKLYSLDLGMNDISCRAIEAFSNQKKSNQLAVLRISSPSFSFFNINDNLCQTLLKLVSLNPRLGDVNFNMGPVEWHHTYRKGKMQWHHFFPAYRVYALHSNNKRVEYLKSKELNEQGKRDLERVQHLLDFNWAGRCLFNHEIQVPVSVWPVALERIGKGRTCYWTGRKDGASLELAHDLTYSFLRGHLVNFLRPNEPIISIHKRKFMQAPYHSVCPKRKKK